MITVVMRTPIMMVKWVEDIMVIISTIGVEEIMVSLTRLGISRLKVDAPSFDARFDPKSFD